MSQAKSKKSRFTIDSDEELYGKVQKMQVEKQPNEEDSKPENAQPNQIEQAEAPTKQTNVEVIAQTKKKMFPMFETKQPQSKPTKPSKPVVVSAVVDDGIDIAVDKAIGDVLFGTLTKIYEKVGNYKGENSKNFQKTALCGLFKAFCRSNIDDLIRSYLLSVIKLGPDYEKQELGVGREILTKAISKSCGKSEKQIRDAFQTVGDLGDVAMTAKTTQKTMDSYFIKKKQSARLTINTVFETFVKISRCKGNNSATEKQNLLMKLLMDAKEEQTKYIIRWVEGNLKISAAEKTMQSALIRALFEHNYSYNEQTESNFEQYEAAVMKAMAEYPNEAAIIRELIRIGSDIGRLEETCKITPGVPCKPMLAKPTKDIGSVLARFENKKFTCEFKYDGLRGQIHYANGKVSIYSRNLENMTEAYPDIVEEFQRSLGQLGTITSFIIDSEIVAIHPITKQILPFQVLSTRSRKAAKVSEIQVTISVYAFDVLYLNGPLTHLPLSERRKKLLEVQPSFSSIISLICSKECESVEEIDGFLQEAIKGGTEGLMIKDMGTGYFCSRRSWDWVKLKKDYLNKLGDTLDVVPIGGNYGAGKRTGLFGAYLLAIYNPDMEVYETLCKIGTGFSDVVLEEMHKYFADKAVPNCPREYRVASQDEADVWFTPSIVWEVKGADFQLSPVYTCGKGTADANRGIGLRFPRLIKIRTDKKPVDSSNTEFVVDMYKQQAVVQNNRGAGDSDVQDYY